MRARSIGLNLDDVLECELNVIGLLEKCKQHTNGSFKVFLFQNGVPETKVEEFIKRNNKNLINNNIEISNKINERVFFLITKKSSLNENYRYKVEGNIITGLSEYIKMMQHIINRERKGR